MAQYGKWKHKLSLNSHKIRITVSRTKSYRLGQHITPKEGDKSGAGRD